MAREKPAVLRYPSVTRSDLLGRDHVGDVREPLGGPLLHQHHGELGAVPAVGAHDGSGGGAAGPLVAVQGLVEVAGVSPDAPGEHARIEDGLGRPVRADRVHRVCRIAEECAASKGPAGERFSVDHREEVRRRRLPDDRGHVEPSEVPRFEPREEVAERSLPVPILRRGQVGLRPSELGHEVERLLPSGEVADGVADELLLGMAGPDHGATVQHGIDLRHTTPEERTVPARRPLGREALRAGDAVDPVGRHHDVRLDPPALEDGGRAPPAVIDPDQPLPEVQHAQTGACDQCVQHDLLQHAAVRGELGPAIAGGEPPALPPDLLAPFGAVDEQRRGDRSCPELPEQAQGFELQDGVRQEVDPHPERAQLPRRLEDLHLRTDLVEAERRCQTADPGPDDDALEPGEGTRHRTSCTSMRTTARSRRPVEIAIRSLRKLSRGADVVNRTWVRK